MAGEPRESGLLIPVHIRFNYDGRHEFSSYSTTKAVNVWMCGQDSENCITVKPIYFNIDTIVLGAFCHSHAER